MIFLLLSFGAIILSFFSFFRWKYSKLSYILFLLASLFRPALGADYQTYESIYNGELGVYSGSSLFDSLLWFFNLLDVPYRLLSVVPVLLALTGIVFASKSLIVRQLLPLSACYSCFNIFSVNISKTSMVISLLIGIASPLAMRVLPGCKNSGNINRKYSIAILAVLLFCFLVQPAITIIPVAFALFFLIWIRTIPLLLSFLAFSRFRIPHISAPRLLLAIFLLVSSYTFIAHSSRYSEYLINQSAYVFTDVTRAEIHSLPFYVLAISVLFGILDPMLNSTNCNSHGFFGKLMIAFPLALVGSFYLYIQAVNLNSNLIGRSSIMFSFVGLIILAVILPLQYDLIATRYRTRVFIYMLILCMPLIFRGLASFSYANTLS